MTLSAFANKAHQPTDEDLRPVLGKAHAAWSRLVALVSERIAPISQVWSFSSASSGWSLRLKRNERVILHMLPLKGHFQVSFALGEKAVVAAHARKLPASVLKAVDSAPRYAEGRGIRFQVRQAREASALATLAEIKHAH